MFAFMNPDYTVHHTANTELGVTWNQCYWNNLRLVAPAERHANLVYDFVPLDNAVTPIGMVDAPINTVNQATGTVTQAHNYLPMDATTAAAQLLGLQTAKSKEISDKRDDLHLNGGVLVGTDWYGTDAIRRTQWLGLMVLGSSIPAGVNLWTLNGTAVPLTQALVQQIFAAIVTNDAAQVQAAHNHDAAMLLLADPRQYVAHNDPATWPAAWK